MRGEEVPETEEYGIGSFVYERRLPFHPERLWARVQEGWPGVVRAKGFFWVATRHDVAGLWSQAGGVLTIRPLGTWWASLAPAEIEEARELFESSAAAEWREPWGDRRQQLAFIGSGMDREAIAADLDACLLDEAEMAGGPAGWARLTDPLPDWRQAVHDH